MNRDAFLPFSKPSISDEDIQAVTTVMRSGWITTGPNNTAFEDAFGQYTGCQHAIAIGSATAGMHLLLRALNIGPGDEVITPSMTWVSTINMIVLAGAKPVFVDVDRDTLMAAPAAYEACLSERTRLMIPVHYAGAAVELGPLRELAARAGVTLVEDAAHALGTKYQNERVGQRGTSIFSFHPIKNMTTGEGGMFCTDDAELAARIRRLKFHGLGVDAFDRQSQGRAPQAEVQEPGYKYNLTDMAAALGISQLARLDAFNAKRTALATYYRECLADIPEILPLQDPAYEIGHSWHLFIVRLDIDKAGMDRRSFMEKLKERNIGTGLHFLAVHVQRYYRDNLAVPPGALPETEWNSDRICSLPLFPDMTSDDVDDVVAAIKDVLAQKD